jgi:predicted SPOUT superfamily RNA methylase MTH1
VHAAPREERGLYWGYLTRIAPTLQSLLDDCPFDGARPAPPHPAPRPAPRPPHLAPVLAAAWPHVSVSLCAQTALLTFPCLVCAAAAGGYDLTVGTSERGEAVPCCQLALPCAAHVLVVIGGPQGLELCLQNDPQAAQRHADPSSLFARYLNVCPDQGSRTIRTEEALLIALAFLQPALGRNGKAA